MAWFNHVNQTSSQQQLPDTHRPTARDGLFSTHHNRGPAEGPTTMVTHTWTGFSSPSPPNGFPAAPQGVVCPPSLGDLSFTSSAGQARETEPISYVTLQEQRCVLSWFQGWTATQRERFLQDLLGKAVPGKVCTLLDSLGSLQVTSAPSFVITQYIYSHKILITPILYLCPVLCPFQG